MTRRIAALLVLSLSTLAAPVFAAEVASLGADGVQELATVPKDGDSLVLQIGDKIWVPMLPTVSTLSDDGVFAVEPDPAHFRVALVAKKSGASSWNFSDEWDARVLHVQVVDAHETAAR